MSCYRPLKAFTVGITDSGKAKMIVTSNDVDHLEWSIDSNRFVKVYQKCSLFSDEWLQNYIEVPCGRCLGCRLDKSKEWANRCMLELNEHESSFFITLTYDDDHLPYHSSVDDNGEYRETPSLDKRDFQLFMKRLRKEYAKKYNNKLRFYMCGEYGSNTFRPHYHVILFGLKLDDLVLYKMSDLGYNYYNSQWLQNIWGKGFVVVGEVTQESCAYTARYVMKKVNADLTDFYESRNIVPEFTLMSRKPGIAYDYYKEHNDLFDYRNINLGTERGSISFRPPRYFEKRFEIEYPDQFRKFKDKNYELGLADSYKRVIESQTSVDYYQELLVEENVKKKQIASLKRGM